METITIKQVLITTLIAPRRHQPQTQMKLFSYLDTRC